MKPYKSLVHGGDIVSWRELRPGEEPLDFSANVNPLGMPDSVRRALAGCADAAMGYPDPLCRDLRRALSGFEDVPEDWILCGAGAAEMIFRLVYALRPRRALLMSPTFAEYELALRQAGCEIVYHELSAGRGFIPDASILDQVSGCDMVIVCNPNNPTGALAPEGLPRELAGACEREGAVLLADECFVDFLTEPDRHSLKKELERFGKLVILRAFTKIFAIPGLRMGYALCSSPELLRRMDEAGPAWSVSVPAQVCGVAACGEKEWVKRTCELVAEQRVLLERELAACGLRVFPGSVNYVFFHSGTADLATRMARRGVLIRDCANYRGLFPGYYRVAVGLPGQNRELIRVLREELAFSS